MTMYTFCHVCLLLLVGAVAATEFVLRWMINVNDVLLTVIACAVPALSELPALTPAWQMARTKI